MGDRLHVHVCVCLLVCVIYKSLILLVGNPSLQLHSMFFVIPSIISMHLTHAQTRASPTIQTFTNNGNHGILSHDFRISSILT